MKEIAFSLLQEHHLTCEERKRPEGPAAAVDVQRRQQELEDERFAASLQKLEIDAERQHARARTAGREQVSKSGQGAEKGGFMLYSKRIARIILCRTRLEGFTRS